MTDEQQLQPQTPESEEPTSVEEDEEEIQELGREVRELAERIIHFRRTVPDLLKKTLESFLTAKRPVLPRIDTAEAGIGSDRDQGAREKSKGALLAEEDPESAGKICLIKSKISSNISAMPVILKRMNECIAAIDKLGGCEVVIHPTFKRKRT